MANPITLRVITPDAVALDETVDSVVLPGLDGQLGVLARHATMVTALNLLNPLDDDAFIFFHGV